MKTGLSARIGQRLVVGLLGLTAALTVLPHSALAGYTPTAEQASHILKVESNLAAQVLVSTEMQGYGSNAIATAANAAKTAMHACMTAGYAKGLDAAGVNALCGPIIDAYLVAPKGDTVAPLTLGNEDTARAVVAQASTSLARKIGVENAAAVGYTLGVCAKAHLKRNYDWAATEAGCTPIYRPFAGLPEITDPSSPFFEGPPVVKASAAPAQPATTAPKEMPEPAEGEGWAGNSEQQVTVGQDGPTQLEVREENLSAGQNNSNSNTKKDDGPCDKCKGGKNESSGSGSGSNSNSNSGGGSMHPHR